MTRVEVFHASTCCSSGACGPGAKVIPETLASDLQWLADWGVDVFEYSLARQPGAFAANPEITAMLTERGGDLPAGGCGGRGDSVYQLLSDSCRARRLCAELERVGGSPDEDHDIAEDNLRRAELLQLRGGPSGLRPAGVTVDPMPIPACWLSLRALERTLRPWPPVAGAGIVVAEHRDIEAS